MINSIWTTDIVTDVRVKLIILLTDYVVNTDSSLDWVNVFQSIQI